MTARTTTQQRRARVAHGRSSRLRRRRAASFPRAEGAPFAQQTPRLALHQILQHPWALRECEVPTRWKIARLPAKVRPTCGRALPGSAIARHARAVCRDPRGRHWRPTTGPTVTTLRVRRHRARDGALTTTTAPRVPPPSCSPARRDTRSSVAPTAVAPRRHRLEPSDGRGACEASVPSFDRSERAPRGAQGTLAAGVTSTARRRQPGPTRRHRSSCDASSRTGSRSTHPRAPRLDDVSADPR